MADTSPKKKVAAKPKKPAAHPKYSEMVGKAIAALKERGGSSRQAILKYIMANFNVGKDAKTVNVHLKLSLRAGVKNKSLKQSKGTGASGSFKIGEVVKPKTKPAAKPKKAVKPKAAKPKIAKTPKKLLRRNQLLRRKRRNQRPRNRLQQRNQPLNLQRRLPSHQKRLQQSNLRRHQRRSKLLSLTCWHLPPTALLRATQILQKESKLLFHNLQI